MTTSPETAPAAETLPDADSRGVIAADGTPMARIERAALVLFAASGIDAVTTRAIATRAGVAEGSIYRHYPGKEALASALFDAIHGRLYELVENAITGAGDDFEAAVTQVVAVYCEAADRDRTLFEYHLTHMFRFGRNETPGRPDPTALIVRRIERAMADGDCPRGDAELKAAAALGVVLQPAAHRMAGRYSFGLSQKTDSLGRAALAALRAA